MQFAFGTAAQASVPLENSAIAYESAIVAWSVLVASFSFGHSAGFIHHCMRRPRVGEAVEFNSVAPGTAPLGRVVATVARCK